MVVWCRPSRKTVFAAVAWVFALFHVDTGVVRSGQVTSCRTCWFREWGCGAACLVGGAGVAVTASVAGVTVVLLLGLAAGAILKNSLFWFSRGDYSYRLEGAR